MKILVTDGEERAALAATRSLGRSAEVHVAASSAASLAGVSRSAAGRHALPDPLEAPDRFREEVARLVGSLRLDAILPIADGSCVALLPEPAAVAPARLLAPSWPSYQRLSDKHTVAEIAGRHGIAPPEGALASGPDEAAQIAHALGWPAVVKPVASVARTAGSGSARSLPVTIVEDEAALRDCWARDMPGGAALVQRCVPGWGEGLFLLRASGRTRAAFAHRRLREKPPGGGVSVLRESIAVDPDLLARVEGILDDTDFEGVAMAEFRTDGARHWLMEFNVRLWGSLQLAIDAGVDFPRLLLESIMEPSSGPRSVPEPRLGVRSRWLLGDLDHALALARGRPDTHGRSGLAAALGVLLRPAGPDCRWEVLRAGDPRPFCVELRRWLRAARRAPGPTPAARARAVDPRA